MIGAGAETKMGSPVLLSSQSSMVALGVGLLKRLMGGEGRGVVWSLSRGQGLNHRIGGRESQYDMEQIWSCGFNAQRHM